MLSRQLLGVVSLPVSSEEVYVGEQCSGEGWVQDEDVLDTWFPECTLFSTLGWPNTQDLLKRYFPTNTLVTGYDIIFFCCYPEWYSNLLLHGRPFEHILIHGLIVMNKEQNE